jgi:hypothetical protein
MHIEGTCADIDLSFTNGVSEANIVKQKLSKTGIKIFARLYMDGGICLSVFQKNVNSF